MRCFMLLTFVFACFMAMALSAAIEEVAVQEQTESEGEKDTPTDLSDVDTGVNNGDGSTREARQFLLGFGRPYYGGYGGFGRPYGGYYGRPYGGYYGRPYGGYYGRPYGYGGFYG